MSLDKLKQDFIKVIKHAYKLNDVHINLLFKDWIHNKRRFIKAFKGLIYEYPTPISITLTKEEQEEVIEDFLTLILNVVGRNPVIYDYFQANKNTFFENKVENNFYYTETDYIPAGTKLLKGIKFLIDDKDLIDFIQTKGSAYIQRNKIKGILCLSVHPLDFLSVSENAQGWRSCHALDGGHCAGNLSYMTDQVTSIAYIKASGGNKYILPHFPEDVLWNSKKWRLLTFLSIDGQLLFHNRQYPYNNEQILNHIAQIYHQLHLFASFPIDLKEHDNFKDINSTDRYDLFPVYKKVKSLSELEYFTERSIYIDTTHQILPISTVIYDNSNLHYNDVLFNHKYSPTYHMLLNTGQMQIPKIPVGHEVKCLCCNKNLITSSDTVLCNQCYENQED